METIQNIVIAVILNALCHEGGHFVTTLVRKLHPKVEWVWCPSPGAIA